MTRTAIADDDLPRRPVDGYTFTSARAARVLDFLAAVGDRLTPWQEDLIRLYYDDREPYRTTAHVGRPAPEIETGDART